MPEDVRITLLNGDTWKYEDVLENRPVNPDKAYIWYNKKWYGFSKDRVPYALKDVQFILGKKATYKNVNTMRLPNSEDEVDTDKKLIPILEKEGVGYCVPSTE
jgi:hypothetical protein